MTARQRMLVDQACWNLAVHFLADEKLSDKVRGDATQELAEAFQRAAEDFLSFNIQTYQR